MMCAKNCQVMNLSEEYVVMLFCQLILGCTFSG